MSMSGTRQEPGWKRLFGGTLRFFMEEIPRSIRWALGSVFILLALWGVSILTIGIFLGVVAVVGIWLTIEQIPGIKQVATTRMGMVVMSLLTGYLVHLVIGTATATGMIAASTALVVKYFILKAEANKILAEQEGYPRGIILAAQ